MLNAEWAPGVRRILTEPRTIARASHAIRRRPISRESECMDLRLERSSVLEPGWNLPNDDIVTIVGATPYRSIFRMADRVEGIALSNHAARKIGHNHFSLKPRLDMHLDRPAYEESRNPRS